MANRTATIGIIGAGQLARMLIEAATPLDLDIHLLAATPDDCAARIWPHTEIGSPDDPEAVGAFAKTCDVITFDHELVPESVLVALEQTGMRLAPSANTLRIAQNKQRQRELFAQYNLPQPRFRIVRTVHGAQQAAEAIGYPVILKTAFGGYDGRGVWRCATEAELVAVADELVSRGIPILVEAQIAIERELAVMVARDHDGRTTVLPTVETVQHDGICRQITYRANRKVPEAVRIAEIIANAVDLTGVMAVELFESGDILLINEIATRPHNSGHYSIEALVTSQFEHHLRSVLGLAPGSVEPRAPFAATVNLLGPTDGDDPRDRLTHLASGDIHVHLYGKQARPGRKLGHVTVPGDDLDICVERAWAAAEVLTGEPRPEEVK
jgi:5-(carboxyamino)imidazole ribonucleotide synthase